jgi:DNA-binding MarR family transcriptional regulator
MKEQHPAHSRIAYTVGRLDRALRQRMGKVTAEHGLTVAQYTVLSVLQGRGRLSNAELARRSLVSPQAMNEIVEAMSGKRLVARRPDPEHGRIVHIALTGRGESVLAKCDDAVRRLEAEMLAGLNDTQRRQFQALLRNCIGTLERSASGTSGRADDGREAHATH